MLSTAARRLRPGRSLFWTSRSRSIGGGFPVAQPTRATASLVVARRGRVAMAPGLPALLHHGPALVSAAPEPWEKQMATIGRVCVVGAGPAGLSLARAFLAQDIPFDVYERHHDVGGLWDQANPGSPVYDSAHFISSKSQSHFHDFPMPEDYPDYPRTGRSWRTCAPSPTPTGSGSTSASTPAWPPPFPKAGLEGDPLHRRGPQLRVAGLRQRHQLASGDAQLPRACSPARCGTRRPTARRRSSAASGC